MGCETEDSPRHSTGARDAAAGRFAVLYVRLHQHRECYRDAETGEVSDEEWPENCDKCGKPVGCDSTLISVIFTVVPAGAT